MDLLVFLRGTDVFEFVDTAGLIIAFDVDGTGFRDFPPENIQILLYILQHHNNMNYEVINYSIFFKGEILFLSKIDNGYWCLGLFL